MRRLLALLQSWINERGSADLMRQRLELQKEQSEAAALRAEAMHEDVLRKIDSAHQDALGHLHLKIKNLETEKAQLEAELQVFRKKNSIGGYVA